MKIRRPKKENELEFEENVLVVVESINIENLDIDIESINIRINFNIVPKQIQNPRRVVSVNFFMKDSEMKGKVVLDPLTDTTVTSSPVQITFGGGSPSVTVDMFDPNVTFDVPASEFGGSLIATPMGDVSPSGVGPAGAPFSAPIPASVGPPARNVKSVDFSN